jgi:hypothetical protein
MGRSLSRQTRHSHYRTQAAQFACMIPHHILLTCTSRVTLERSRNTYRTSVLTFMCKHSCMNRASAQFVTWPPTKWPSESGPQTADRAAPNRATKLESNRVLPVDSEMVADLWTRRVGAASDHATVTWSSGRPMKFDEVTLQVMVQVNQVQVLA